jgi:hypothetical protein
VLSFHADPLCGLQVRNVPYTSGTSRNLSSGIAVWRRGAGHFGGSTTRPGRYGTAGRFSFLIRRQGGEGQIHTRGLATAAESQGRRICSPTARAAAVSLSSSVASDSFRGTARFK